jgi:3-phosphoshikimate 1-carboxyvinyltransferase
MQISLTQIPKSIKTRVVLPISKSISNRLLVISALSENKVELNNLSDSDDTRIMTELLNSDSQIKDAGHAGTTMRFLTAYYSLKKGVVTLTGTERMKNRPIGELVEALRKLGADIEYLEKRGYPPLKIKGGNLKGGRISIESGISSQYISAILLIAPCLEKGLEMELKGDTLSYSYIDMTLSLMKEAGAIVEKENNILKVKEAPYREKIIEAEADWSSASYWFMIAGLHPDCQIVLKGLFKNSFQGDALIISMFENLGVGSVFTEEGLQLSHSRVNLREFRYDFRNTPDMVQSFVPYCIARNIPFYFSGCRSLRIKETDRVTALHRELRKFNVEISFSEDGDLIWWDGKSPASWKTSPLINTYKDHRMALGMAPLSIKAGEITIEDPDVISKSYPGFWDDLKQAGFGVEFG